MATQQPRAGRWSHGMGHGSRDDARARGRTRDRPVGGTVGAVGGTVYGLVAADSASTIAAAEDALTRAVADVDVQRSLREHVLRELGEHGSLTFVDLGERTAADGAPEDHRRWKHDGIDTVLDVRVSQLRLAGGAGVKPRVGVSMVARARLIRTADGAEVYAEAFEYGGGDRPSVPRRSGRAGGARPPEQGAGHPPPATG